MAGSIVWITGASGGIGSALARTVPWRGATVIGIGRSPLAGAEHIEADLAQPSSWPGVGEAFRRRLQRRSPDRAVLIQAAGTVEPIGFAGEVDGDAYAANVVLNGAAPQAVGHLFLEAVRDLAASRQMVILTSGAARSIYPGWSSYGAAKAAVDQWVRDVGAEQATRGGVRVLAVAPGTVDTRMQAQLRATTEDDFPQRRKFVELHQAGGLSDPDEVARSIWELLDGDLDGGSVVDLRELARAREG